MSEERDVFTLEKLPYGGVVMDGQNYLWQKAPLDSPTQFPGLDTVWLSFGSSVLRTTARILPFGPFTVVTEGPSSVKRSILGMTVEGWQGT
jgi:hypothetical protein